MLDSAGNSDMKGQCMPEVRVSFTALERKNGFKRLLAMPPSNINTLLLKRFFQRGMLPTENTLILSVSFVSIFFTGKANFYGGKRC